MLYVNSFLHRGHVALKVTPIDLSVIMFSQNDVDLTPPLGCISVRSIVAKQCLQMTPLCEET